MADNEAQEEMLDHIAYGCNLYMKRCKLVDLYEKARAKRERQQRLHDNIFVTLNDSIDTLKAANAPEAVLSKLMQSQRRAHLLYEKSFISFHTLRNMEDAISYGTQAELLAKELIKAGIDGERQAAVAHREIVDNELMFEEITTLMDILKDELKVVKICKKALNREKRRVRRILKVAAES